MTSAYRMAAWEALETHDGAPSHTPVSFNTPLATFYTTVGQLRRELIEDRRARAR